MLGHSQPEPITEGAAPGRLLAIAGAVALVLGGIYYAWTGSQDPAAVVAAPAGPAAQAAAVEPLQAPARTSYVVDSAHVLSAETLAALDTQLAALNVAAGPQLVVMTVPELGGAPIESYSLRVARQWAIGDPSRNDGVLLLVAPNQRQVRIEVGTGLQDTLSNADCKRIIDEAMLPHFRAGRIEPAILAGTNALDAALRAHPTLPAKGG
ncbi:MAG: TPM domain-containing protein [Novosphingobium sp.]